MPATSGFSRPATGRTRRSHGAWRRLTRRARHRQRLLRLLCLVMDLLAKVVILDLGMMLLQPFPSLWALEALSQRRRCAPRTTMAHSSWAYWLPRGGPAL